MPARDTCRFLGAFLRHPTRVGAIAPSSDVLARAMVRDLALERGEAIIEFGPGTGPFTVQIARLLDGHGGGYLGIEREPRFVALLRSRFPGLRFIEGSAEHAGRLHQEANLGRVRAIISGLPFASLPAPVQDGIVTALNDVLGPGCIFRTFQYVHAYALPTAIRFRRRMNDLFGPHHRSRPVLRNLPPAYVLTWQR